MYIFYTDFFYYCFVYIWSQQIDCYDYDDDGSHDFIGSTNASMRQLIETKQSGVR